MPKLQPASEPQDFPSIHSWIANLLVNETLYGRDWVSLLQQWVDSKDSQEENEALASDILQ